MSNEIDVVAVMPLYLKKNCIYTVIFYCSFFTWLHECWRLCFHLKQLQHLKFNNVLIVLGADKRCLVRFGGPCYGKMMGPVSSPIHGPSCSFVRVPLKPCKAILWGGGIQSESLPHFQDAMSFELGFLGAFIYRRIRAFTFGVRAYRLRIPITM